MAPIDEIADRMEAIIVALPEHQQRAADLEMLSEYGRILDGDRWNQRRTPVMARVLKEVEAAFREQGNREGYPNEDQ